MLFEAVLLNKSEHLDLLGAVGVQLNARVGLRIQPYFQVQLLAAGGERPCVDALEVVLEEGHILPGCEDASNIRRGVRAPDHQRGQADALRATSLLSLWGS